MNAKEAREILMLPDNPFEVNEKKRFAQGYIAALEGEEMKAKDAEIDKLKRVDGACQTAGEYTTQVVELKKKLQFERKRSKALVEVLERNKVAIDDWLHQYAAEFCDEKKVEKTWDRIRKNHGTLAYIADIQEANFLALKQYRDAVKP